MSAIKLQKKLEMSLNLIKVLIKITHLDINKHITFSV